MCTVNGTWFHCALGALLSTEESPIAEQVMETCEEIIRVLLPGLQEPSS